MPLFHIPQCSIQSGTVTFLIGALWDLEQVHSDICELSQLNDVCVRTYHCDFQSQLCHNEDRTYHDDVVYGWYFVQSEYFF